MDTLHRQHRQWARMDGRNRITEGGIRLLAGLAVWVSLLLWGWVGVLSVMALLGVHVAVELGTWLRHRGNVAHIAAHIDQAGETDWLMQTALAIEAEQAIGGMEMAQTVHQQALAQVPTLSKLAVKDIRLPMAWIAVAVVALVSVAFRGGHSLQHSATTVTTPAASEMSRMDIPGEDTATEAATHEDGASGRRSAASLPNANGEMAHGEDATGEALGVAASGDGVSDGGSGNVGMSDAASDASRSPQNQADNQSADASASPRSADPTPPTAALLATDPVGDQRSPTADVVDSMAQDASTPQGMDDGAQWTPQDSTAVATADDAQSDALQANEASGLPDAEGQEGNEGADTSQSRGAVMTPKTPTIASLDDDRIWNPFSAGAGMGGVNDASATEDHRANGARDRHALVDVWVDSAQTDSPQGRVQRTETGQSGGRSGTAYATVYTEYAALAEEDVQSESLPPGRRALIQQYFEAIQPEEGSQSP